MQINVKVDDREVKANLKDLRGDIKKATEAGLKDLIVAVANGAIKGSPVLTGNNKRSIKYEAKGLSAATFSTSGYGGFLETGTVKMAARPYFKPALDQHLPRLGQYIKEHL